jgi:hypothetical protein
LNDSEYAFVLLQPPLNVGLNVVFNWSVSTCEGSTTVMATAMQKTVSLTCDCNEMSVPFSISFTDANGCPSNSSLTNAGGYTLLIVSV